MTNEEKILRMLESLTSDVAGIKSDISSMKTDIAKLERGQHRLETRLENEAFDKIRAIFDASEVQLDVNDRMLSAIARIEGKVDRLSLKVVSHDVLLKNIK